MDLITFDPAPLRISHHPHPLLAAAGRSFHAHGWRAGETVREVLLAHGFDAHQEIVIGLNDRLLTVAEWDAICPAPGDLINVQVAVSGGGGKGGSNPLAVVASIGLMFLAPQIAVGILGETLAATTIMGVSYGTILGGVVSLAGNALINAVFKPTGNGAMDRATGISAASPTYSLAGGSNALRPYEPLPIVMGVHRIFPDYGAKPFTELSGKDQYLYQIFNFGVSVLELSDFRIGSTPLSSFSDVAFYWPAIDGRIAAFPGNVDTTSGGEIKRVSDGGDWVTRTTSADTVALAADVEGAVVYVDKKYGPLPGAATVEVEYAVAGSGSWLPMGRFAVPVYGTHYWSMGNWSDVVTPSGGADGSPDVVTQVWGQLTYGSTTYGDHAEGAPGSVPGTAPYYQAQTGTWRWRPYSEILSNGNGSALTAPAPAQPVTVSDFADYTIYHGTSPDTQRTTFRKAVASGQYDVRVRLTSVTGSGISFALGAEQGSFGYTFTQLRSYQEDNAAYLGQQRLGVSIKASGQLNGVLQQLSALAVAYCNVWDGADWQWRPSSNPAWWYLDFARGRRNSDDEKLYGLFLAEAAIDVDAIKAWATFCDAQGLSFNAVIDRRQSCADTLTMIARCGLASTSWASGKLGVIWDVPDASPVMAFGMGNIARGSFNVGYLSENLADEIVVRFVDASRDWQQQEVRVTVPGTANPERTSTIDLMGCTNAAMAGKFANVVAAQQYYRRRTVSWETDFEGFVCQRGDVVLLSHDLTQWGYSGRIVSVAGDVVTLDRAVPRTAVDYLMIRQPDGTLTTYTVTAGTGDSDTLTLTSPPAIQGGTLAMDHVWLYSPLPTPGKLVKIISVQPLSESRVRIIATDEDPAFYAAWGGAWSQPANNTLLQDVTPQITGIDITETLALLSTGVVGSRIGIAFATDRAADLIALQWRVAGGPWTAVNLLAGSLQVETLETGLIEVEARPFYGVRIGRPFNASAQIMGKIRVPGNVTAFAIAAIGGQAHLSWSPANDIDVQIGGYLRLRHTPDIVTPDWSSAIDIGPQIPGTATSTVLPLLAGTYLAKWVDSLDLESTAATGIVTNAADVLGLPNVVASFDQHPGFTGSKTGVALVAGGITLDSLSTIDDMLDPIDTWPALSALGGIATSGDYLFDAGIDLGDVVTSRLTAYQAFTGYDMLDLIDGRPAMDEWLSVDGDNISDVRCGIFVRSTDDDPAGSPAWSGWQALVVGDYRARAFEFKATLETDSITHNVLVTALSASVDMPDRIESGEDIASGAGAYSVTYAKGFMVPPALGISAQNMATGDYYVLANKDAAGFDITFKNAAGTAVSRTFDYITKGY